MPLAALVQWRAAKSLPFLSHFRDPHTRQSKGLSPLPSENGQAGRAKNVLTRMRLRLRLE